MLRQFCNETGTPNNAPKFFFHAYILSEIMSSDFLVEFLSHRSDISTSM
jgi:hypothetical protein